MKRVVVVGGGISGLAAAYRLRDCAQVTLLEAGSRLSVIRTERRNGYVMEAGPDAFLNKGGMVDLCRELNIEDQLIGTEKRYPRSFIVKGDRLIPVPEGLYLMAPASFRSFAFSPVVSLPGKLRMAMDLALPRRKDGGDETLASFVRRRLGNEALDRIAQPLIGGIYTADPERLSLAATMPQFLEMERRNRSVIKALWLRRRKAGPVSGARYGLFLSFRNGMQTLVDALSERIPDIEFGRRVEAIEPQAAGSCVRLEGGAEIPADAVCLCVPAPEAARLVPALGELRTVPYASSATVNFGFRREQIRHPLDGMGFVVPDVEKRSILACSFSSVKFAGRAPEGRVLLRAFLGGTRHQDRCNVPDDTMVASALRDLADLLGVSGDPEQVWVNRFQGSMPQYQLGHLDLVARVAAEVHKLPGLELAGNGYRGVGVPDCITGGFTAADRIRTFLEGTAAPS